jgi:hypothetical protein
MLCKTCKRLEEAILRELSIRSQFATSFERSIVRMIHPHRRSAPPASIPLPGVTGPNIRPLAIRSQTRIDRDLGQASSHAQSMGDDLVNGCNGQARCRGQHTHGLRGRRRKPKQDLLPARGLWLRTIFPLCPAILSYVCLDCQVGAPANRHYQHQSAILIPLAPAL